jgi:transcriptional regulator with XRE-family HTH domain
VGEFASRLGAVLTRLNLKQVEAARLIGIPQGTLSRYLAGKEPSFENATKIAAALGIPMEELTGAGKGEVLREAPAPYVASPWLAWAKILRADWKKHPARHDAIRLAIRTAWPNDAEEILAWLDTGA